MQLVRFVNCAIIIKVMKMKGRRVAFSWAVIHSLADTLEEKILIKYNESQYLFFMRLISGIVSLIFCFLGHIEMSIISFGVLVLYSLAMSGGDFCYAKAIQTLPIGLVNLVDSGSLFLILICDIILGYIKPKLIFLILFIIFFIAIYIFSYETNKMKQQITNKKIDLKNIFVMITATIFYASEPYFIKLASSKGANELGINLIYNSASIPLFYGLYLKEKKQIPNMSKENKKEFGIYTILVGIMYAVTGLLNMIAYQTDTPILIALIMKLQLFFVVILSVIRKTDKMNWKKTISLLVGVMCILIMSFINS